MKISELREIIREEIRGILTEVKLQCQECGKKFSRKKPTMSTKCPKCGGYDIDLDYGK